MRVNETRAFRVPTEASQRWYQLSTSDPGESRHGTFVVAVASPVAGITGQIGIAMTLKWDIEWEGPHYENNGASDSVITPDAGYQNIYTDSDGGVDATRLTFKMHAGASYVPFTAAIVGAVYSVAGSTRVPYYDEAGTLKYCTWFARMLDGAGLWCFSSQAKAQEYNRTGDITAVLPYKKAGEYTVPVVPTFKFVPVTVEAPDVGLIPVRTEVEDARLIGLLHRVLKDLGSRPRGTLDDPVKVFSEDPVVELAHALLEDPPGIPMP